VAGEERQRGRDAPSETVQPQLLSALLRELAATDLPGEEAWGKGLEPGETIGRFELLRELGRGGFGVVYEARDRELGRSVAFKAVRPGKQALGDEQLLREAEAIARLSHPNLVTLFDVGRCDRGPYLVLEMLRGITLQQQIELGPVPVREALRIGIDMARGLAHAHGEGVVHRDLKPSNVFLCDRGTVKLLDFGLAHAFGRQPVSGGTPLYMAPEQWKGAPEDERTDVFALGVILYQMLAGELPFAADGGKAVLGPQPAPELQLPELPALGQVVAHMLAKDPARRLRNGAEALAELEAVAARLESPAPRRGTRRAFRVAVALAAVTALVAVGLVIGARMGRRPPGDRPPTVAVLPFTSLSTAPEDAYFAEGIHGELIAQIARIGGLRVIARGSVQGLPAAVDRKALAKDLGVDALLEGTVQRAGGRVRVSAALANPETGEQLWADRYDRELADAFAIQTDVALEIARALGARLTPAERRLVERPPTRDREAHDLFLRGVYYWERSVGVEADNQAADDLLAKATARDPSFALAHAWRAVIRADWQRDCALVRIHADRAIALASDLPEAHAAVGSRLYNCDKDRSGAIREYELAARGAPGSASLRSSLGILRTLVGQFDEGLADLQAAQALDPRSYLAAVYLAAELARARRFPEAAWACERAHTTVSMGDSHVLALCALVPFWRDGDLAPARRALEMLPRTVPVGGDYAWSFLQLLSLFPEETLERIASGRIAEPFSESPLLPRAFVAGTAQAALGRRKEARASFSAALGTLEAHARATAEEDQLQLALLFAARARAGAGQPEKAMEELRRALALPVEEGRRSGALRLAAEVAVAAGRPDEATAILAEVLERRDGLFTPAALRVDPRFAPLRSHPRFAALLAGDVKPAPR